MEKTPHKILLISALLALMCSCSDRMLNENSTEVTSKVVNVTFSFDSITEPNNWARYQTLEEMMAACQIPDAKLKSMSKAALKCAIPDANERIYNVIMKLYTSTKF